MTLTLEACLAFVVGCPLIFGFVCRIGKASWWTVRTVPLLFHLLGGVQCICLTMWAAKHGTLGVGWVGFGFAGLWLVWSYYSWAGPVPQHARRAPPEPTGSAQAAQRTSG